MIRSGTILLLVYVALPLQAFAQESQFVSCDGSTGDPCSWCNLVDLGNGIITWLIGILFIMAGILVAVAGIKLVTSGGNTSALDSAKSSFQNAVIGLVIVFSAWLLVDTLMRTLLPGDQGMIDGRFFWSEVECWVPKVPVQYTREGNDPGYTFDSEAGGPLPPAGADGTYNQAQAEAILTDRFDISSSGGCTDRTQTNCTSLDGVRQTTLDRALELQNAVGERLVITGGTEAGHSTSIEYSHSNGYKLDLRPSTALNSHIYNNYEQIGPSKYRDSNGNTYYRHGPHDHWDITITN